MTPKETLLAEFEKLYGKEPIDGYVPGGECADSWHYASEKTAFIRGARAGLMLGAEEAESHYESHCCEDCPCDHWRAETGKALRTLAQEISEEGK